MNTAIRFVALGSVVAASQALMAQERPDSKSGVDPSVLSRRQEILLSPFPVDKVSYVDEKSGKDVTVGWATLTPAQQRALLPNEELFIEVSRTKTDGSISILPAMVTAEKGTYQFNYRWMKYRVQYCNSQNKNAGHMRVGVGLEIVVNASTTKGNINVAGIGPFQAAASRERFRGSLNVGTIGLGTSSAALGGFLGNSAISEHAAAEADKAIAVVKAVIENNDTKLTPHTLTVVERNPGACTGHLPMTIPAAARQMRLIR